MSLRVVRPGLLTSVQDLGRVGWQRHGVVIGGAMDTTSLRIANLLVGNEAGAAALEVTLLGPTLEFLHDHLFALAGADLDARLDGMPVPCGRPCAAAAGSTLSFIAPRSGCRVYIALAGGIDVPEVLGSRSTDLRAGIGGHAGRALAADDVLTTDTPSAVAQQWLTELVASGRVVANWGAGRSVLVPIASEPVIRVLPGIEYDNFTAASRDALEHEPFIVSSRSDRMGYRLEGPSLMLERPLELISAPVPRGTVQVPPSGGAIVLMADAQSVGGYPRLAHVITVDLPLLAQAAPGTRMNFRRVTLTEAHDAYLQKQNDFEQLMRSLELAARISRADNA